MKTWKFISFLMILPLLAACSSDEPGKDGKEIVEAKPLEFSDEQLLTLQSVFAAEYNLWEAVMSADPDSNHSMSPHGLHAILTMLANGADGVTRQEIEALLSSPENPRTLDQINDLHKLLYNGLPNVGAYTKLKMASSIWLANGVQALPEYVDLQKSIFGSDVYNFNSGSVDAMKTINDWCKNKTEGMIPDYLNTPPSGNIVLLNAMYFASPWKSPFDKSKTVKGTFNCASGKKSEVMMMNKKEMLVRGTVSEHFRSVRLMTKDDFCCVLVLPNDGVKESDYPEELKKNIMLSEEYDTGWIADITLPRFKMDVNYDLTSVLRSLGLFGSDVNLSKINPSWINQGAPAIQQRTLLEIDETGAKGASVTSVDGLIAPLGDRGTFIFDRPFTYAIYGNGGGLLYIGHVAEL